MLFLSFSSISTRFLKLFEGFQGHNKAFEWFDEAFSRWRPWLEPVSDLFLWLRKAEVFTEAQKLLESRETELIEAKKQADLAEPGRVTLVEKLFHGISSCFASVWS